VLRRTFRVRLRRGRDARGLRRTRARGGAVRPPVPGRFGVHGAAAVHPVDGARYAVLGLPHPVRSWRGTVSGTHLPRGTVLLHREWRSTAELWTLAARASRWRGRRDAERRRSERASDDRRGCPGRCRHPGARPEPL